MNGGLKGGKPGMNVRVWNYLKTFLLVGIQGCLTTILFNPWLQLAQTTWRFPLARALVWVFGTMVLSISVLKKMAGRGKRGLPLLALGLAIPLVLALVWQLPLVIFFPLTIALLYLGARFGDYPKRRSFALDWALASLLLILTALFEGRLGYHFGLGPMLIFFVLGMLALIIWNAKSLEGEGLAPDYGGLSSTITLFVVVVGTLALLLGILLSPSFLQAVLNIVSKIYSVIADGVILFIVKPFAWLMSPLFRWAENLEKQELQIEAPEIERVPLERSEFDPALSPAAAKAVGWGGWLVFTIILAFVLWLVIKKILNRPKESTSTGVRESRESVFSRGEILEDLKGAWQSLVKPLGRLGHGKWYRGKDPLLIIRTYYARFAVKRHKYLPFAKTTTPLEYAMRLSQEEEEINQQAVAELTNYYNEARYGERGDEEAVKGTEKAFRQL